MKEVSRKSFVVNTKKKLAVVVSLKENCPTKLQKHEFAKSD